MTTPTQLREALERAASQVPIDLDAAETRVRARAAVRRRRYRLVGMATAAVATAACLAIVFVVGLGGSSGPNNVAGTATLAPGLADRGTYLLPGFPGNAALSLPSGWTVDRVTPGDVRLSRREFTDAGLGFALRPRVFRPATTNVVTVAPTDLAGWLKSHPDLVLVSSSPIRSGSYLGTSIEVQVKASPRTTGAGCAGRCLPLFQLAGGPVVVPASATLRVVAINEAGRVVVAYSWASPGSYSAWSQLADAVIAALRPNG